jgi:hypothetical protein
MWKSSVQLTQPCLKSGPIGLRGNARVRKSRPGRATHNETTGVQDIRPHRPTPIFPNTVIAPGVGSRSRGLRLPGGRIELRFLFGLDLVRGECFPPTCDVLSVDPMPIFSEVTDWRWMDDCLRSSRTIEWTCGQRKLVGDCSRRPRGGGRGFGRICGVWSHRSIQGLLANFFSPSIEHERKERPQREGVDER